MTIRPRGSKFQADITYDGKRYRETFDSYQEAEIWEAQTRGSLLTGKPVEDRRDHSKAGRLITMAQLRELTIESYWAGTKGEKSACINSLTVVNYFGPATLPSAIDETKIHQFTVHLRNSGLAGSTINSKLAALSKMMRLAKKLKAVSDRPEIERVKNARGRESWITEEREKQLLSCLLLLGAQDIHDLVIFLLDTGARTGEALKLDWPNCHEDRAIFMDTKSGKNRVVPLTSRVREMLQKKSRDDVGPFTEIKKCGRLRGMWDRAKFIMKLSDDPEFVPHICRHTFCSRLAQRGVPLAVIQKLAGHADITTTLRYAHLAPVNILTGVEVLEPRGDGAAPKFRVVS